MTLFQFRIATVLALTFAVASVLATILYVPLNIAQPVLLFITVALPGIYAVGICYGNNGHARAFCVAAVFPHLMVFLRVSHELERVNDWSTFGVYEGPAVQFFGIAVPADSWRRMMATTVLAGIVTGFLGVAFRVFLERHKTRQSHLNSRQN